MSSPRPGEIIGRTYSRGHVHLWLEVVLVNEAGIASTSQRERLVITSLSSVPEVLSHEGTALGMHRVSGNVPEMERYVFGRHDDHECDLPVATFGRCGGTINLTESVWFGSGSAPPDLELPSDGPSTGPTPGS